MKQIAKRDLLLNVSSESLRKRVIIIERILKEKIPKAREEADKIRKSDVTFGFIPPEPKQMTIKQKQLKDIAYKRRQKLFSSLDI